jgi:hypothetical protein
MPELSRFFGIIIRMFAEPSERHHTPHFHAYYQEHIAVFSIFPVALIAGSIPQRQQRLVEAWAELHQDEVARGLESPRSGTPAWTYCAFTVDYAYESSDFPYHFI